MLGASFGQSHSRFVGARAAWSRVARGFVTTIARVRGEGADGSPVAVSPL